MSARLQQAGPGAVVSLSFRVASRTDSEEEFIEALTLPPDWRPLLPHLSFSLAAGEETTRIAAFQVPPQAGAGRYEVSYAVRSQRDYAIQDLDTVEVAVERLVRLSLLLEAKPEVVIAGDEYEARVRVVNQGNTALQVSLDVQSEERYPARIAPPTMVLPAGHSEVATVIARTDAHERRRRLLVVEVRARATQVDDGEGVAGLPIAVEVVPRVTQAVNLTHEVPAALVLRTTGEGSEAGTQVELHGYGAVDEAGAKSVEFLLRGPDTQDDSVFGWRDEYRLNYYGADLDVRLGDQNYGLSPLTESFRYGRGVEVASRLRSGRLEWRAYMLRGRWGSSLREVGASASRIVSEGLALKVNWLRKETDLLGTQAPPLDRIWSVEAALRPAPRMDLRLEYARSDSDRGGGVADDAYAVEWRGRVGKAGYYSLTKTRAQPDYHGYYSDSDYTSGSLVVPLGQRVHAGVSFRTWERNLGPRPQEPTAPRERLLQVGLRYQLPSNWYLAVDQEDFRRRDDLLPADFDYRERPLTLTMGTAGNDYSLRFDVRSGRQQDFVGQQTRSVRHYSLFGHYRPTPRQSVTLYGGIGDRDTLAGSYLLSSRDNVGVAISLRPRDNLRLNLNYVRYGFRSERRQDQKEAIAAYAFPDGRTLTMRVRNASQRGGASANTYLLEYSIPFGVPVGKKKSVGAIAGRVYHARAPGTPGIPDVILLADGATAVTDSVGRFAFPALAPGTYTVTLDRRSIGLNRVAERKWVLTVEVRGGETTPLEIGLVEAARVVGTVVVAPGGGVDNGNGRAANGNGRAANGNGRAANGNGRAANGNGHRALQDGAGAYVVGGPRGDNGNHHANGGAAARPQGLPSILVELSDGEEILRTATDHKGEFLFEGVRPGRWRLKIYDHNLPAYHYLESPEMDLELAPAASERVLIHVLPQLRAIKILGQGTIENGGPQ